jgi:hypothetical protein
MSAGTLIGSFGLATRSRLAVMLVAATSLNNTPSLHQVASNHHGGRVCNLHSSDRARTVGGSGGPGGSGVAGQHKPDSFDPDATKMNERTSSSGAR